VIVTRFAPSPTGDLHLGGAWTALASWVLARRGGGRVVLRVEDLDPPRVVKGSAERILEDLARLGLDWDDGPVFQSRRGAAYEEALQKLELYPCDCSRAEIARIASAPHAGEETVYPGICRDKPHDREMKRAPAWRLRVPEESVSFDDGIQGKYTQHLAREVGDFVLRRADGVFAYQLAVVVDDLDEGITDVVRGADLLSSTPRQILLARLLGKEPPRYWHVPLVVAADGARLAKRTPGAIVRDLALPPEQILGELAFGLGLAPDAGPRTAREIANQRTMDWRTEPWPIPSAWAAG
jgi:glutamyl-tRNA synthetase